MNFQREWVRRSLPTLEEPRPRTPYATDAYIEVHKGQSLDIDLADYVDAGPAEVLQKPYFMVQDGTHLKGTVPDDDTVSYKILVEDRG